jgi:co-chaperonin GroES (HSP10)
MLKPAPGYVLVAIDPSAYNHITVEQKSYESSQQGTVVEIGDLIDFPLRPIVKIGKKVRFKAFKEQDAKFHNAETGLDEAYIHIEDIVASEVR